MVLVLTDDDVRRCLSFDECIDAIERACHEAASGALVEARVDIRLPSGWMRIMPAALTRSGVIGYKEFHLVRVEASSAPTAEVRYAIHLFDAVDGSPLAMLDANHLTAMRTASTAALAARYMSPEDARVVSVIGSGAEARAQLEAISRVCGLRRVLVYSRSAERRGAFAVEMAERLGVGVEPVDAPERAVEDAEILVVATNTGGIGPA